VPYTDRQPTGELLLMGGNERMDERGELLAQLIRMAGGRDARILVCAAASRYPEEVLPDYDERFRELGADRLALFALEDRHASEDPEVLEKLETATAVFFTGGDQFRLTSIVAGTEFSRLMWNRFLNDHLVVAGTSAGATAMGSTMIASSKSHGRVRLADVNVGMGLGYLPDTVIDSHFNERSRINRLLTIFAQNSQILGLGIDENTALRIRPGEPFDVYGTGAVTVLDGRVSYSNAAEAAATQVMALSGVTVHVVPRGFRFDIDRRAFLVPAHD